MFLLKEKAVPKCISNTQRLETFNFGLEIMRKWERRNCRHGSSKNWSQEMEEWTWKEWTQWPTPVQPRSLHDPYPPVGQLFPAACGSKTVTHRSSSETVRSQTTIRCYLDDLPQKSDTHSSRKEFYLWAHPPCFPWEINVRPEGWKMVPGKKKKKHTSDKFW